MINRRHFLKGLAASAAAVTVAIKTERELHRHIYDRPMVQTEGFGLEPATPRYAIPRYAFDPDIGIGSSSKDTLTLHAGGRRYLTGPNEWYITA